MLPLLLDHSNRNLSHDSSNLDSPNIFQKAVVNIILGWLSIITLIAIFLTWPIAIWAERKSKNR